VIPTSNQDGHQAKNRKRGDEILIVHCCQQLFYGMTYLMILEKFPILISLRIF
jgi:hypothetical protein